MIRTFYILFFLLLGFYQQSRAQSTPCPQDLHPIDVEFHELKNEDDDRQFIATYSHSSCPNIMGYVEAIRIKMALHAFWPWEKLEITKAGIARIEAGVQKYPENFYFRYARLMVQANAPGFLNYNTNIKEDWKLIEENYAQGEISEYLMAHIRDNIPTEQ